MRAPSFYSDPHVQFLAQLLEEVSGGYLQVPRFQRPMVWLWERRLELLRSIRDGIPIGAIMVWRTASAEIECYTHLGPHRLAEPPSGSTRQYLLDGVQRLSTLYGALHKVESAQLDDEGDQIVLSDDEELSETTDFNVFVDLERADFCTPDVDDITAQMMPLHVVFDSVALLRFQRHLGADGNDKLISASDQIARAFRDYKIPIIPITTDDVDMATRTFQRINSQGVKMSEAHMVHALTWSKSFNLNKKLVEIKNEILLPRLWDGLDPDIILKASKAALDLNVYRSSGQELSDAIRSRQNVLNDVGQASGLVADFLKNHCGIPLPELVPYALQIVLLIEAFRQKPKPSLKLTELLRAWFWMTTYGELFASMTGDRLNTALIDMRLMVETEKPVWTWKRPFEIRPIENFDFRTARAKALSFRLADAMNHAFNDERGSQILTDAGRKGLAQILPWSRSERSVFSSPANRFLAQPASVPELRDIVLQGRLSDIDMRAHIVSYESLEYILAGRHDLFVTSRLADIHVLENDFVEPLVSPFLAEA